MLKWVLVQNLVSKIDDSYRVNMILDNLPVTTQDLEAVRLQIQLWDLVLLLVELCYMRCTLTSFTFRL